VDYSATKITSKGAITDPEVLRIALEEQKPDWAGTRWICTDGINADIVSVIADRYQLHPLAVEDLFHFPQRVKVDRYPNLTFISVHLIGFAEQLFPKTAAEALESQEEVPTFKFYDPRTWNQPPAAEYSSTASTQLFLILTPPPENTLILFCQDTSRPLAAPIVSRLRSRSTLLRSSADPSFLLYALLDCIVDHSVLLIRSYQ
jgi:Mg2+ and Co2+ transporter CorA